MKGRLLRAIFGVSTREVSFERRGFRGGSPSFHARVERIGCSLLEGYHAAIVDPRDLAALAAGLDGLPLEYRGFAYEGAAMGLALLDGLSPRRRDRLRRFIAGPAAVHVYMALAGLGWAMARLPAAVHPYDSSLDPLRWWLVIDGYGFHEGFFHPATVVDGQQVPAHLRGYDRRAFDQGVGRCLWFVEGAEPDRIQRTIGRFAASRRADLWSGVGLACCYAAGGDGEVIAALRQAAQGYEAELAQGVVFAATARTLAGNATQDTEMVCRLLIGRSVAESAQVADDTGGNLQEEPGVPVYEIWRRRIQSACVSAEVDA